MFCLRMFFPSVFPSHVEKMKIFFNREIDEDLYVKPPKNEEERKTRIQNPRTLATRLMYCDLLSD